MIGIVFKKNTRTRKQDIQKKSDESYRKDQKEITKVATRDEDFMKVTYFSVDNVR